jgi:hypothetical protein
MALYAQIIGSKAVMSRKKAAEPAQSAVFATKNAAKP